MICSVSAWMIDVFFWRSIVEFSNTTKAMTNKSAKNLKKTIFFLKITGNSLQALKSCYLRYQRGNENENRKILFLIEVRIDFVLATRNVYWLECTDLQAKHWKMKNRKKRGQKRCRTSYQRVITTHIDSTEEVVLVASLRNGKHAASVEISTSRPEKKPTIL